MALIFPSPTLVAETRLAVLSPPNPIYMDIRPSTPGNSLYVIVGFIGAGCSVNHVVDSASNSWTVNPTFFDPTSTPYGAELWCYTPSVSITQVHIELIGSPSLALIRVLEFDQAGVIPDGITNNAAIGSGTSPNSGSQTALANDFFIAVIFADNDATAISAIPNGYIPVGSDFTADTMLLSVAIVPISGAGTADFTATLTPGANWVAMLSCFEAATAIALGTDAYCSGECFLNVPDLAIADNGTWTYSLTGYIHGIIQALAYSPALSLWVAAGWQEWIPRGPGPTLTDLATQCIATSPDLTTWTLRSTPADPGYYRDGWISSVIWAPSPISLFVAVGYDALGNSLLMTSSDGITWPVGSPGTDVNYFGELGYSPDLTQLIAIGYPTTGSYSAEVSSDGSTWTDMSSGSAQFPPVLSGAINNFPSHPVWSSALSQWFWLASSGPDTNLNATPTSDFPIIITSTDGVNWTEVSSTAWPQLTTLQAAWPSDTDFFDFFMFSGVAYSDSLAIIVVTCQGQWTARNPTTHLIDNHGTFGILVSADGGASWKYTAETLTSACSGVVWSSSLGLFAVAGWGFGANEILTSPDGYIWTVRYSIFHDGGVPLGIVWENSTFVVFGEGFDNSQPHLLVSSTDGITWTEHNTPYDGSLPIIPRPPILTSDYCDKGGASHLPTVSSSVGADPHPGPTSDFW